MALVTQTQFLVEQCALRSHAHHIPIIPVARIHIVIRAHVKALQDADLLRRPGSIRAVHHLRLEVIVQVKGDRPVTPATRRPVQEPVVPVVKQLVAQGIREVLVIIPLFSPEIRTVIDRGTRSYHVTHRLHRPSREEESPVNLRVERGIHPEISHRSEPGDGIGQRRLIQGWIEGIIILLEVPALGNVGIRAKRDVFKERRIGTDRRRVLQTILSIIAQYIAPIVII